jgi:hypothetical protein
LVALTLATTSATAPSAISGRRPPPNANPGNPFFEVWSWDVSGDYIARSSPLTTIPYNKLDPNGYRQHWNAIGQLGSSDSIISFSNTYHGKRYILGDEANIDTAHYGDTEADARLFADHYCDAVAAIHNVDGTATFVPGGFADGVAGSWLDAFVDEYHSYSSGKCDSIPIAEWDFHIWGTYSSLTDFYNRVATYESWAWNNGAPMSLGLWQLDFTDNPDSTTYMTRFRMAKNWLASRPHISVTRYSGYYPYSDFNTHSASDSYGNLSAIGSPLVVTTPTRRSCSAASKAISASGYTKATFHGLASTGTSTTATSVAGWAGPHRSAMLSSSKHEYPTRPTTRRPRSSQAAVRNRSRAAARRRRASRTGWLFLLGITRGVASRATPAKKKRSCRYSNEADSTAGPSWSR